MVLSDWRLPGSPDGLALLQAAQAAQPAPKLAALITGEDQLPAAALTPGLTVLRKPLRLLHLRRLVERQLAAPVAPPTTP